MSTRGEMSPPRRRRTSPPPASLPVDDDMLREILLRLPPLPSSLPRASLVCKRWRRLVTGARFQRRFRDNHGKPPLLGFFVEDYHSGTFAPMLDPPDRIPAARFSMPLHQEGDGVIDCRHGLALFLSRRPPGRLVVRDPVAREQHLLIPPPQLENDHMFVFKGAVLRPVRGQGCRSRHFQVALIAHDRQSARVSAGLYSSETGIWGNISSSLQVQPMVSMIMIGTSTSSTLIGNSLCWLIQSIHQYIILEFDLDRQRLAVTELPPHIQDAYHKSRIMPAEDGGLGFIYLTQSHAQLWKRMPDSVWVLDRAIEFENLLGSTCEGEYLTLEWFAEESKAVLVRRPSGVFVVYLQSMEFKKLSDMNLFFPRYPFEYCYAAGTGILDGHDGDEVLNNM